MASKVLKTSVKLDTKQAVRSLDALEKKIRNVQRAINNQSKVTNKLNTVSNKLVTTNHKVASSTNKTTQAYSKQGRTIDMLTTKVHRLANAYLGVMGAAATIKASDTITNAENRLNNLPGANPKDTQLSMDKMFTSSQNARTSYSAMMNNVSKSMTLAGDAFGDNIDNAIRFQEIMAKSYTLGGASQAEQHSSMYQMIQGLGSGILQGDELRSVREGAPIAYKKIEEFAQGVYGAEENLKDLASQGKITSDIVVAAIMSAGEDIDEKFLNTAMTFDQAWTMIKNTALKSFEPVLQMLNDALNSDAGKSIINGIGTAIQIVAGSLQILFSIIGSIYNFVITHSDLIKTILVIIGTLIGVVILGKLQMLSYTFGIFVGKAIAGLVGIITNFILLGRKLGWATALSTLFGVTLNLWVWIAIAALALLVIALIWVSESFVDACGIIVGSVFWVGAVIYNVIATIINYAAMLLTFVVGVATNIGVAFYNAWQEAKVSFWEWVQECLTGSSLIAKAVSKIAQVFGLDSVSIDTKIDAAKGKMKDYVDLEATMNEASNIMPLKDLSNAYDKGYELGTQGGQWITDKLGDAKDWFSEKLNLGLPNEALNITPIDAIDKNIGNIDDNTGSIKDAMELTQEDLEYLRKVADMEWKKEFTTANITVDMSNYNTINGNDDLDGIVTKLTDKLYEELHSVANGVYV